MKRAILAVVMIGLGFVNVHAGRKNSGYGSGYGSSKSDTGYGSGYGTGSNPQSERVGGYTKRDGTYVEPSQRSKGNDTQYDNWSTKGNQNPYTGAYGTKKAKR